MQQLYIIAAILATSQFIAVDSAELYDKSSRGKGYPKRGCCDPTSSYYVVGRPSTGCCSAGIGGNCGPIVCNDCGSYGGSCTGSYDLGKSCKPCSTCDGYPTSTYGSGYGSCGSGYGSYGSGYGSYGSGYDTCGSGCGACKTRCVSCGTGYGSCGTGYSSCGTGYGSCGTLYGSCGTGYGSCGTGCGSCGSRYSSCGTGYGSCGTGLVSCGTGCSSCGSYPVYSSPCDSSCPGSYSGSCSGSYGSYGGYGCRSYGGYSSGDACGCGTPAVCHYVPSPQIKQVVDRKYDRGNGYSGRNDACYPSSSTYCAPNFHNLVAPVGRDSSQHCQFGYQLCPLTSFSYRDQLCPQQFDSSYISGSPYPVTHQSLTPLINCRSLQFCDQGQFPQLQECYSQNYCTKWQTCNTFPETHLDHYNYFKKPNPSVMYLNHPRHNNTQNVDNSNIHKTKPLDLTSNKYKNNNILPLSTENNKHFPKKRRPSSNKQYSQNDLEQNYRVPQSQYDIVSDNYSAYDQHSTEYHSQRPNDYYQGEHNDPKSNYENSPELEWVPAEGNENNGDDRGYNERINDCTRDTSENRYYNRFSNFKPQLYSNKDHYDEHNTDNGHISDYSDSDANYDYNN